MTLARTIAALICSSSFSLAAQATTCSAPTLAFVVCSPNPQPPNNPNAATIHVASIRSCGDTNLVVRWTDAALPGCYDDFDNAPDRTRVQLLARAVVQ